MYKINLLFKYLDKLKDENIYIFNNPLTNIMNFLQPRIRVLQPTLPSLTYRTDVYHQKVLPVLESTGISEKYYHEEIKPFVLSLGGKYKLRPESSGPLRYGIWPITWNSKFYVDEISLSGVQEFIEEEISELEIKLLNLKEFRREKNHSEPIDQVDYNGPEVSKGMEKVERQSGLLCLNHNKKHFLKLNEPKFKIIPTVQQSDWYVQQLIG